MSDAKKPADAQTVERMVKNVNDLSATVRILEERHGLIRSKSQVTEQSLIELDRGMTKDIKALNDEIIDLKHDLRDILEKLRLISDEMKNMVDKNDFRVLERYLDMWQPMDFVTKNELSKMIEKRFK